MSGRSVLQRARARHCCGRVWRGAPTWRDTWRAPKGSSLLQAGVSRLTPDERCQADALHSLLGHEGGGGVGGARAQGRDAAHQRGALPKQRPAAAQEGGHPDNPTVRSTSRFAAARARARASVRETAGSPSLVLMSSWGLFLRPFLQARCAGWPQRPPPPADALQVCAPLRLQHPLLQARQQAVLQGQGRPLSGSPHQVRCVSSRSPHPPRALLTCLSRSSRALRRRIPPARVEAAQVRGA